MKSTKSTLLACAPRLAVPFPHPRVGKDVGPATPVLAGMLEAVAR